MESVVFLDFDGVLNCEAHQKAVVERLGITSTEQYLDTFAPWCTAPHGLTARVLDTIHAGELLEHPRCDLVRRLCEDTDAAIVVVSSWRRYDYGGELAAVLHNAGIKATVLGSVGGVKMWCELRASAIREWLADHPSVVSWVVLDDDREHYRHDDAMRRRVVNPVNGITVEDCEAARAILRAGWHMDQGKEP